MSDTRWDLVYKWADPETRSIVDKVVSALENCDRKLTEAEARAASQERPSIDVAALSEACKNVVGPWFDDSHERGHFSPVVLASRIAAEYLRSGPVGE